MTTQRAVSCGNFFFFLRDHQQFESPLSLRACSLSLKLALRVRSRRLPQSHLPGITQELRLTVTSELATRINYHQEGLLAQSV